MADWVPAAVGVKVRMKLLLWFGARVTGRRRLLNLKFVPETEALETVT